MADTRAHVNVLIVAPAWVGDMVMAHALVRQLFARHQTLAVDLLAPPATAPLGARMPGVRQTHRLDVGHGELGWAARRAMARRLADENYDQAIVLPNSFKSALIPWWAGIDKRTGWSGESRLMVLNDRRRLDKSVYPLMIQQFLALGLESGAELPDPLPLPKLSADADNAARLCADLGIRSSAITALCPGAEFGAAKRWPAEHFAAVARAAVARGREVWLLGSPNDAAVCREVEALVPTGLFNLAGQTRLTDAVDLLSLADEVVCNDSGLMHVACALGRRVVALFGSTSPDFTPPLAEDARVLRLDLECSPCFERECPLGHLRCLRDLGPERVIEVL